METRTTLHHQKSEPRPFGGHGVMSSWEEGEVRPRKADGGGWISAHASFYHCVQSLIRIDTRRGLGTAVSRNPICSGPTTRSEPVGRKDERSSVTATEMVEVVAMS